VTIAEIYERFAVPPEAEQGAFLRACFVRLLKEEWLGERVDWRLLYVATLCTELGDASFDKNLRKKVGVDKYVTTLIARTNPTYFPVLANTHDVQQLLFAYTVWHNNPSVQALDPSSWSTLKTRVESSLLSVPPVPATLSASCVHFMRSIQIYHYKNPSV
jgi:hypothetical protein